MHLLYKINYLSFSVDARDRDFGIAERWSDDTVFSNRAYFMPDKKPAELGVDHIREEDAGIYRCRVDFQIGQTRNSKVNLTVIGEYSSLSLRDEILSTQNLIKFINIIFYTFLDIFYYEKNCD